MIGVGEQTGAMDAMLQKIADFYEEEVDDAVSALTSLMEPLLMLFLGITVGGIVGGYLPVLLFHASAFSVLSLVLGLVGCVIGAWLGWKVTLWIEE